MVLDATEKLVVDNFVEINHALHAALRLWFLQLLLFLGSSSCDQASIFLFALLELLVECTDSFLLHFLGLRRLELVDVSNKFFFHDRLFSLVWLRCLEDVR